MPNTTQCPSCGQQYDITPEYAGKRVECACGAEFTMPDIQKKTMTPLDVSGAKKIFPTTEPVQDQINGSDLAHTNTQAKKKRLIMVISGSSALLIILALLSVYLFTESTEDRLVGSWQQINKERSVVIECFEDGKAAVRNEDSNYTGEWTILKDGKIRFTVYFNKRGTFLTGKISEETLLIDDARYRKLN